jgi:putative hydrolase of the HAD superfamily
VKLSGIRAITFDAAGTLVDPYPSVGAVYAEIGRQHGLPVEAEELERRFRTVFKVRRLHARTDEAGERIFWRGLAGEVFAPWADAATMDHLYPELWETFAEARRWRPRTDVPTLFSALRARGLRLAILSNWDSRLHRVIDGHGWLRWLDGVFISSELGAEKPSPEIFTKVACSLDCAPHELLHVGDSIEHDITGALAAGWHAAWLDHGKPVDLDPRALRLQSLEALPELLAS